MVYNVRIYTIPNCPYCSRAKALLNRKGIPYQEILCTSRRDLPTGLYTFPQVYIGSNHVGGCAELYDLDKEGSLA